jgi:single-strand DNA-binding protein
VYWPDVVIWGSKAEKLCENLDKGSYIIVEGKIQTRQIDDQSTGKKRNVTEVVAEQVFWMDNAGSSSNNTANNTNSNQSSANSNNESQSNIQESSPFAHDAPNGGVMLDVSDDDLPF